MYCAVGMVYSTYLCVCISFPTYVYIVLCDHIFSLFTQLESRKSIFQAFITLHTVGNMFGTIHILCKVEKILKGNLDLISSTSLSVKIQIMVGKVCLRCKGKILLGIVNKLLKTIFCLITSSCPIIWIFTEGEVVKIFT